MNEGSLHHSMSRSFLLELKLNLPYICKSPRSSASSRFKILFSKINGIRREVYIEADTEDLNTMPPSDIRMKRSKAKEVDIPKSDSEFVFPCRTVEILPEEWSASTVVYHADGDTRQEFEEGDARDPDPDIDARQVFWSVVGDYIFGIMLLQGLNSTVPNDDFPTTQNFIFVLRETNPSVDVLQQATIDDY